MITIIEKVFLTIVWTGRFSRKLQFNENLEAAANFAASSPDGAGASATDFSAIDSSAGASTTCSTLCSSTAGCASPFSLGFSKAELKSRILSKDQRLIDIIL